MLRITSMCAALVVACTLAHATFAADDAEFVKDAAMDGMTEVQLGKIATQNGASADVKAFGAKMVEDHSKANSELMALATKKNWTVPSAIDAKHQKDVDKMSALTGAAFDKQYVDAMVEDHKMDVKKVSEALKTIQDPDLKTWAQSALSTMEMHLKHIEGMAASNK